MLRMTLRKEYFDKVFVGLYLFAIACLYSEEHIRAFYIITIAEFVIAAISAFTHMRFKRIVSNTYFLWLICVFGIYMLTPTLNSAHLEFSYAYFSLHLMNTFTILFFFFDEPTDKLVHIWCDGSVIGSVMTMLFIIINEAQTIRLGSMRIGESASGNVDVLGMYLGVMSIFVLYRIIVEQNRRYLLIYALQVAFMLLTGSKQALIYIAISYLIFIKYTYKNNIAKYIIPFLAIVGLIIAIFEVPALYEILGYRLKIMMVSFGFSIEGVSSSFSTDRRIEMIQKAFQLFAQHPIFGGGWGYFTQYSGFKTYSHTTYTEILVTYGLFGFLVYYSLFFHTLFRYMRVRKNRIGILLFVLLLSILVADIARITFSQTSINYVILFIAWKALRERAIMLNSDDEEMK